MEDTDFLELLEELRILINSTEVERYNYFISHSPEGRQCGYALKSLQVFQTQDQRRLLTAKLNDLNQILSKESP